MSTSRRRSSTSKSGPHYVTHSALHSHSASQSVSVSASTVPVFTITCHQTSPPCLYDPLHTFFLKTRRTRFFGTAVRVFCTVWTLGFCACLDFRFIFSCLVGVVFFGLWSSSFRGFDVGERCLRILAYVFRFFQSVLHGLSLPSPHFSLGVYLILSSYPSCSGGAQSLLRVTPVTAARRV